MRHFKMSMSENENQNESEDENENDEISARSNARPPSPFAVIINANRYESKNRHLMETLALKSLEFHRTLLSHEVEDFARQKTKSRIAFRSQ